MGKVTTIVQNVGTVEGRTWIRVVSDMVNVVFNKNVEAVYWKERTKTLVKAKAGKRGSLLGTAFSVMWINTINGRERTKTVSNKVLISNTGVRNN